MKRFIELAPKVYFTTLVCAGALAIFATLSLPEFLGGAPVSRESLGWGGQDQIWTGEIWRIPVNTLHHADYDKYGVLHIAFNLIWIWILGSVCELTIGSAAYGLFLLGAAVFSSTASNLTIEPGAVGLSGVVYSVFGLMLHLRKRHIACAEILPRRTVEILILWLFICVALTWAGSPIANVAHFSGFAYGWAAGWAFVRPDGGRNFRAAAFLGAHVLLVPALMYVQAPIYNPVFHFETAFQSDDLDIQERGYSRALELREGFPEARHNLALVSLHMGKYEEAIEHADIFLKMDHKRGEVADLVSQAVSIKSMAMLQLGRKEGLADALRQLETLAPEKAEALRRL